MAYVQRLDLFDELPSIVHFNIRWVVVTAPVTHIDADLANQGSLSESSSLCHQLHCGAEMQRGAVAGSGAAVVQQSTLKEKQFLHVFVT